MTTYKFVTYAVWFGSEKLTDNQMSKALDLVLERTLSNASWSNSPANEKDFQAWFKVGRGFYLLHALEGWSPGDICGAIKGSKRIDEADEIVAVRMDANSYIPRQGLLDPNVGSALYDWQEQIHGRYLVRND